LARSPTRAEAEVEMTFQPGDTVRLSKLGESRMKRAPAEDWKDRGSRKQKPQPEYRSRSIRRNEASCELASDVHRASTGIEGEGKMTDDDPNEANEVMPIEPGPHGPPKGWWTVKRNGLPVRHFPGKEKAERYATDPEYRASLVPRKAWEKTKGK
jgi:hypothetical protein